MGIDVVDHDPDWPRRFAAERALLERALAPWLSGGVHHVGSTSVPGLAATPIVDMVAGVRDLAEASAAIEVRTGLSYVHSPHRPRAYRFAKPATAAHWYECTHHLHLTEPGSDLWRERLAFRDALRADPALRDEYQPLRRRLAGAHGDDVNAYTAHRRAFVARVLAGAGLTLGPRVRGDGPDRQAEHALVAQPSTSRVASVSAVTASAQSASSSTSGGVSFRQLP